jgi:hypothetical protein
MVFIGHKTWEIDINFFELSFILPNQSKILLINKKGF